MKVNSAKFASLIMVSLSVTLALFLVVLAFILTSAIVQGAPRAEGMNISTEYAASISSPADTLFPPTNLYIDDLTLVATWDAPAVSKNNFENPKSPVLGYQVYLDNILLASVDTTTYTINPDSISYGSVHLLGIEAVYASGTSVQDTLSFAGHYLYPPRNFTVVNIETAAIMSWDIPLGPGGTPLPNLFSYAIYRDGNLLTTIPATEQTYFDLNLLPGSYCFELSAVYDLTPYGFPGQFCHSIKAGPACVEICCGPILPFREDWTTGSFTTNLWTSGANWTIAGQLGNPQPSAQFTGYPPQTDYDFALESCFILPPTMQPGTFYKIWADFNLQLNDFTSSGTEYLTFDVWNGATWDSITSFSNNGDTSWQTQHLDITSQAKEHNFKIRFRTHGQNSANFHYWLVDNILVYIECLPPKNLFSQLDYMMDKIHLSWEPPGTTGNDLKEDFEGGTLPSGWLAVDNDSDGNNWLNTIEQGFGFPAHSGNGAMTSASYINNIGPLTPDNWLITPPIHVSEISRLKYWNSAQDPGWPDEHYYVKVSTTTPDISGFTDIVFDGLTPADWAEVTISLSAYAGQTIYLAFQHAEVTDMYYMKLDDFTVTDTGTLNKSPGGIISYDIYRKSTFSPTYTLIASTIDMQYDDINLYFDCYQYYVRAIYSECESSPSNSRVECFPNGINEPTSNTLSIYPNPAQTRLNIESTASIARISVFNALGTEIYNSYSANDKTIQLNTSAYLAGAYILHITASDGSAFHRRFLVVK